MAKANLNIDVTINSKGVVYELKRLRGKFEDAGIEPDGDTMDVIKSWLAGVIDSKPKESE